jgi:hypothetical protein
MVWFALVAKIQLLESIQNYSTDKDFACGIKTQVRISYEFELFTRILKSLVRFQHKELPPYS